MLGNGYISSKILTARKEHFCELCSCKINTGQKYKKVTGAIEDEWKNLSRYNTVKKILGELKEKNITNIEY